VIWEVTPDRAAELLAGPGPLDGIDLLIRPVPGDSDAVDLLTALAARGVRAGVVVSDPDAIPPAARVATRVVIALSELERRTGGHLDRLAFEVKRAGYGAARRERDRRDRS